LRLGDASVDSDGWEVRHHPDVSRTIDLVRVLAGLGVLALGVVACQGIPPGVPPQTFIEGLPVGESVACGDEDCRRFSDFALADLDMREPDHAPVVAIEVYVPDYRTADGQRLLLTRSGGSDLIVVLRLEDGSVRAAYVGCGAGVEPDHCFLGPPSGVSSGG
jgi:hypothetical protein